MAKNNSEFFIHAHKDGELHSFAPGDDLPTWVKVDNPYVSGKKDSEDEPQVPEPEDEAPRRRAVKKSS